MKVALVSIYSMDSTMPLAKHLADQGADVHLYGAMPSYNQNLFVVDFSKEPQPYGFVDTPFADRKMGKGLVGYMSGLKTNYFVYPSGFGKKTLLADLQYAWRFSRHLKNHKFDIIHLIHTGNRFSLLLMWLLRKENLVQTLHEVTGHSGDTSSYDVKILKKLIKENIPVIFNSQVSKDRFAAFRASVTKAPFREKLYKMIRFSLYETYHHFSQDENIEDSKTTAAPVPVILHFGRIVPYKGIDILIDAVKILQETQPVHLVIAGGGAPYFSFEGINSYEFINYAISNEEIIALIKRCTVVVCPYRSASQSGIPMTVYSFNKPIIGSSAGGLKEVIDHNVTGLLVDTLDAPSFASAIGSLISNEPLQEEMIRNIKNKYNKGAFSWPSIAGETLTFYKDNYPGLQGK